MAKPSTTSPKHVPEPDTQQLTVRLDLDIIASLDDVASKMRKTAPPGMRLTRTDALRTAIIEGVKVLQAQGRPRK